MSKGKQSTLFQSWGAKKKGTVAASKNDVIDLCDLDDEDDALLAEAVDNSLENGSGQDEGVCDISFGADPITCTQSLSQIGQTGFDKVAGKLWIYPTNYPVRQYQYEIVQQALFKNTMVTLPTGLGKTFIASVVMYNYYRWYPQGKIVFMAPTKPLVAQQIEACYNIMGIPQADTAEMTGTMAPQVRQQVWNDKRMFFLTPQVLTNDLSRGTCPAQLIKCVVIDEAHKALGNHAYCQVVRELLNYSNEFRVLALSATPGTDIKAVQQVLSNLLISHIEIRMEESPDIKQYSFERKVEKIVVPMGKELSDAKLKYIQVMEVVINRLKRQGVIYNKEATSLSKFLLLKSREAFRQNPPHRLPRAHYGVVEGDFALAISLYHGYELLQLHGLRSLHNYLDGIVNGDKGHGRTKAELQKNADFNDLMNLLQTKFSNMKSPTSDQTFITGHPKMEKLQEVVLGHFKTIANEGCVGDRKDIATRIMIFSQYRDSVVEITDMLKQHEPQVKAMSFIGQSSAGKATKGFTQKEQLKVMKKFREGRYNTLVATCVGEEGLDIGEVDLIICYDASKSPIRLVQRMGRTGRKRQGRIVMLVTEGKEEQIYNQSVYSKKSIHKAILNSAKTLHFYQSNPRMIPDGLTPRCHKMCIVVNSVYKPSKEIILDSQPPPSKKQTDRKHTKEDGTLTASEYDQVEDLLTMSKSMPKTLDFLSLSNQLSNEGEDGQEEHLSLNNWLPWQNALQSEHHVTHSTRTKNFVDVIKFIELQGTLDVDENSYAEEMKLFLDEADLQSPKDRVRKSGSIKDFCVPEPSATKKPCNKKAKIRRSEKLPCFEAIVEEKSDEDLPQASFICGETKDVEQTGKDNSVYQSILLNDDLEDEQARKRIRRRSELKSGSVNKKVVMAWRKSKSPKVRKSLIHGSASVVSIIADTDQNDFQDMNVDSVQNINDKITEEEEDKINDKIDDYHQDIKTDIQHEQMSDENITHRNLETEYTNTNKSVGEESPDKDIGIASSSLSCDSEKFSIPEAPSVGELEVMIKDLGDITVLPPLDLEHMVHEWGQKHLNKLTLQKQNSPCSAMDISLGSNKPAKGTKDIILSNENCDIGGTCQFDDSMTTEVLYSPKLSPAKSIVTVENKTVDNQFLNLKSTVSSSTLLGGTAPSPKPTVSNSALLGGTTPSPKTAVSNSVLLGGINPSSKATVSNSALLDGLNPSPKLALSTSDLCVENKTLYSCVMERTGNYKSHDDNKSILLTEHDFNCDNDVNIQYNEKSTSDQEHELSSDLTEELNISTMYHNAEEEKGNGETSDISKPLNFSHQNAVDSNTKKECKLNFSEILNDQENSSLTVESAEKANLLNFSVELDDPVEISHDNVILAKADDKDLNFSDSDDDFIDTQANFMLSFTDDFIMDDEEDKTESMQYTKTSSEEVCHQNVFTKKSISGVNREPDERSSIVNDPSSMNPVIDDDENVTESAYTKRPSLSKEEECTFTQALAVVHDSENTPVEILSPNIKISNHSQNMIDTKSPNTGINTSSVLFSPGENIENLSFPFTPCTSTSQKQIHKTPIKSMTSTCTQLSVSTLVENVTDSKNESLKDKKMLKSDYINEGSKKKNNNIKEDKDDEDDVMTDDFSDEVGFAQFDLGFDINDDVIPPSPCSSQNLSQMSFPKDQSFSQREFKSILKSRKSLHASTVDDSKISGNNNFGMSVLEEENIEPLMEENDSDLIQENNVLNTENMEVENIDKNTYASKTSPLSSLTKEQNSDSYHEFSRSPSPVLSGKKLQDQHKTPDYIRIKGKENFSVPVENEKLSQMSFKSPAASVKSQKLDISSDEEPIVVRKRRKAMVIESPSTPKMNGTNLVDDDFETPMKPAIGLKSQTNRTRLMDDDFETPQKPASALRKTKLPSSIKKSISTNPCKHNVSFKLPPNFSDDDSDFEFDISKIKKTNKNKYKTKTSLNPVSFENKRVKDKVRKSKSPVADFFEEEAELSGEDCSGDDEDESDLDQYDDSFIGEATQLSQRTAEDMQAIYMKSVRSPDVPSRARFKLRHDHGNLDVYSQAPPEEESQYLEDSFVVDEDEEETEESGGNDSIHEITMMELLDVSCAGRRTRWSKPVKRPLSVKQKCTAKSKRRRIKTIDDSSSEEENQTNSSLVNVNQNHVARRPTKRLVSSSEDETCDNVTACIDTQQSLTVLKNHNSFFVSKNHNSSTVLKNHNSSIHYEKDTKKCEQNSVLESANTQLKQIMHNEKMNMSLGQTSFQKQTTCTDLKEQLKMERLKKQKEKQEEFRRKLTLKNKGELNKSNEFATGRTSIVGSTGLIYNESDEGSIQSENLTMLVDSREINGCQEIISELRFQHKITVKTAQLSGCDYIVSNRLGVDRKQWAEFSNGTLRDKLIDRITSLCDLFDKPTLILEKDCVKATDKSGNSNRPLHWTKYVDKSLVNLIQSKVKVFFTENQKETAQVLSDLCHLEGRKNASINVPCDLDDSNRCQLKFYLSIPGLSYINALNLMHNFKTILEFVKSDIIVIMDKGRLVRERAMRVHDYLQRNFDSQMLPSNK